MATRAKAPEPKILGTARIPLDHIEPNPLNPRKSYHFGANNPHIQAMADSLTVSGQHNPIKVYQLVDKPGYYRVLQGHRRLNSALQGEIMTDLDCIVVATPKSRAEELDWLGSEDSLKDDWGTYSKMEYARDLAAAYGYDRIACGQIIAKTGLTPPKLVTAEKMFQLEKAIYSHVKLWEEYTYMADLNEGQTPTQDFTTESDIRVRDFTPEKAAVTWDIFESLRTNCKEICSEYDDCTLQQRIAQMVSRHPIKEGVRFKAMIDTIGRSPRSGQLTQIASLLSDTTHKRSMDTLVRTTKNAYVTKAIENTRRAQVLADQCVMMERNLDQLGADTEVLGRLDKALTQLLRAADRFEAKLERHINLIEKAKAS